MSNYKEAAYNPVRKTIEGAWWLDDYFGRHEYGVRFVADDGPGSPVYRPSEVRIPSDRTFREQPTSPEEGAYATNPFAPRGTIGGTVREHIAKQDAEIAVLNAICDERDRIIEARTAIMRRAQDEIARLTAKLRTAEEALRPFAKFAEAGSFDRLPDDFPMTAGSPLARKQVTAGDFKRARAALQSIPPITPTINELEPCPHCGGKTALVTEATEEYVECTDCYVSSGEEPEPRAECSNCHHFHPDADDTKYLYGSGLCHLKTEYHKHTKRESSRNWCSAHKPRTPKGE